MGAVRSGRSTKTETVAVNRVERGGKKGTEYHHLRAPLQRRKGSGRKPPISSFAPNKSSAYRLPVSTSRKPFSAYRYPQRKRMHSVQEVAPPRRCSSRSYAPAAKLRALSQSQRQHLPGLRQSPSPRGQIHPQPAPTRMIPPLAGSHTVCAEVSLRNRGRTDVFAFRSPDVLGELNDSMTAWVLGLRQSEIAGSWLIDAGRERIA